MPKDRTDIDGGALGGSQTEPQGLHIDIKERADSAQEVGCVSDGQHVKKRTARIRGNEYARRIQLTPGESLTAEEKHAESGTGRPPAVEPGATAMLERAARHLQRHARGEQD